MKIILYLLTVPLLLAGNSFAGEIPDYHLGTIEVKGIAEPTSFYAAEEIYKDQADSYEKNSVADALILAPGVNVTIGGRNEKTFTIRGFNQRQIPTFLDGIPISQAYDGYTDLGPFSTAMIDSIIIPKGHSSVLYGINTLGGSVNLLSVRPKAGLEGSIQTSFNSDGQSESILSLGTRQDRFYAMLVAGLTETDGYELSNDYQSNDDEDGDRRENSDQLKKTLYLKAGITPSASSEFFIAYNRIDGEWGLPPRVGSSYPRYWRYDVWEKDTLYGVGNFQVGKIDARTRIFYDQSRNVLDAYLDDSYSDKRWTSIYKDSSYGASLTLTHSGLEKHLPSLALNYREDTHKELGSDWGKYSSESWSVGIEDQHQLTRNMTFLAGIGYDLVHPVYANGGTLRDDNDAYNFSTGLNYSFDETTKVHFLLAGKSRFPSLKELYAEALDKNKISNPDLCEETTLNYELGGEKSFGENLIVQVSLFYSIIDDLIETVGVSGGNEQLQNIDSAEYKGVEFGTHAFIADDHELILNYTYLDAKNTSADRVSDQLPDRPLHTLTLGDNWSLTDKLSISPLLRVEAKRYYQDSDESMKRLPSFATFDLTSRYQFNRYIMVKAGVKNAFDRNYSLDDGLPREGRSFFAGMEATF